MKKYVNKNNKLSAFTLVELAIVIVIIGLLVGGVLQGQELITQAKYRSAMKDIEGYRAATATFYGKYNCIPGDCPQGYRFFGDTCGTNAVIATVVGNMGCNGNGNKILTYAEGQLFWRHLSLGKLIKGSFTEGYSVTIATNVHVPSIAIANNVGISARFAQGNPSATACGFEYCAEESGVIGGMLNKNVFNLGGTSQSSVFARGAFMTPIEAFEFDSKFDDGIYYSGSISGTDGGLASGGLGSCGDHVAKTYHRNNELRCRMTFDSGF